MLGIGKGPCNSSGFTPRVLHPVRGSLFDGNGARLAASWRPQDALVLPDATQNRVIIPQFWQQAAPTTPAYFGDQGKACFQPNCPQRCSACSHALRGPRSCVATTPRPFDNGGDLVVGLTRRPPCPGRTVEAGRPWHIWYASGGKRPAAANPPGGLGPARTAPPAGPPSHRTTLQQQQCSCISRQ